MSVYAIIYLFVCLLVCLFVCLFIWLVGWLVGDWFLWLVATVLFLFISFIYLLFFDQATKSDRVYVNAPKIQKEENGNIELVSFNSFKPEEKTGEENKALDTEGNEVEQEINEEILTQGDLMAFAWQISQGMVRRS